MARMRKKYVRRKRPARRRVRRRVARRGVVKRRRLGQLTIPQALSRAARVTGRRFKDDLMGTVASAGSIGRQGIKRVRRPRPPRRNPDEEGTGGYSQWTQAYKSGRFGRLTGKKIDSMSLERFIYTHRRIGPFNDYGQFFLTNYQTALGTVDYPLVLFELNSCNNLISGNATTINPVKRMYQTATNEIAWADVSGQDNTNSNLQTQWQLEYAGHGTSSIAAYPSEKAIHKWSSLDLELWGQKNKPTKFLVQLVQFSEDVLPDYQNRVGVSGEFWQSMIKHYTYNPLAKMDDGFNRKKYKVLKQYKFNIDPTASYENDPDPHVKTLKLFYKFNRMSNFSWAFSNPGLQAIADMNDADYQVERGNNQCQVHPNARIYVMVRASNFTKLVSPAAITADTNPSISWRLRTCWLHSV